MTILPKKKQSKNDDDRENDPNIDRYGYLQLVQSSSNAPPMSVRTSWPTSADPLRYESRDHSERPHKRRHRHRESSQDHIALKAPSCSPNNNNNNNNINNNINSSPRDINYEDFAIPSCSSREESSINPISVSSAQDPDEEFNSGDEYEKPAEHWTGNDWDQKEKSFERALKKKGFIIRKMGEDGACFFRAVADQVYGDQEMHSVVRKLCLDYMEKNSDFFSQFVTENFASYIKRKRNEQSHGNNPEMQAVSEIYNRPIEVYHYSLEPINVFKGLQSDSEPIRLSYHKKVHYDSIVDPMKATIGVGLGLPGFQPGAAEKNLMDRAKLLSEQSELEQAMLEDKLRATDWEATDEAIEAQVAHESLIEWLKEKEKKKSENASGEGTSSHFGSGAAKSVRRSSKPSSPNYPPKQSTPPPNSRQGQKSPQRTGSSSCTVPAGPVNESSSNTTALSSPVPSGSSSKKRKSPTPEPREYFGDWFGDDADIARLLAQSQMEYIDGLKNNASASSGSSTIANAPDDSSSVQQTLPSTSSNSTRSQ